MELTGRERLEEKHTKRGTFDQLLITGGRLGQRADVRIRDKREMKTTGIQTSERPVGGLGCLSAGLTDAAADRQAVLL